MDSSGKRVDWPAEPDHPEIPDSSTRREFLSCANVPDEVGLSVVLIDGWDPILAYRTAGGWYESPHDPIDDEVTMYLELRVDNLLRAQRELPR